MTVSYTVMRLRRIHKGLQVRVVSHDRGPDVLRTRNGTPVSDAKLRLLAKAARLKANSTSARKASRDPRAWVVLLDPRGFRGRRGYRAASVRIVRRMST